MKKIFGIALTLILSICLICVIAVNAADSDVELDIQEVSGIAGSTVDVNIELPTNKGFNTLAFYVYFDNSKLQLVSVERKITPPEGYQDVFLPSAISTANTKGRYFCGWTPDDSEPGVYAPNITATGVIATFKFTIVNDLADGTVVPVTAELDSCYEADLTDISISLNPGSVTVVACDHANNTNELTQTTAPTCTTKGEKSAICSVCGNTVTEDIPVDATAHRYGEWTVTTNATCTTAGVKERVCAYDASHVDTDTVPVDANAHSYGDWTVTTNATCSAKGVETKVCAYNENHKETRDVAIDPTAHNYGEWAVTTNATCSAKGVETRVCANNANHKDTRDIPVDANAHSYGDWTVTTNATCTTAGAKERVCAYDASHVDTDTVPVDANAHNYGEWTVTTNATCTTAGEKQRVCAYDASHVDTDTVPVDANAHNYGEWAVTTNATCSAKGVETRVCANNANHKETRDIAIDENAHSYGDWTVTTNATCSAKGVETRVCANNANHKDTRDILVDADAHKYGQWLITTNSTCSSKGEEIRFCEYDQTHKETRDTDIDENAHNYGTWTVTTQPTADTEGERTRTCVYDASHTQTETLAKLNSTFTSEDGSASITLDDTSLVPTDAKFVAIDVLEMKDDGEIADIQAIVKEKTGKDVADFYQYGLVVDDANAVAIVNGTLTITVPVNAGFENLKYYVISLDDSGFIDVTDKIVEGKLTYDVEEYGVLMLVSAGEKVVDNNDDNNPGDKVDNPDDNNPNDKEDKNPQNGDNAAIPFILVATMLSAAALMVIFKKKVNA